MRQLFIKIFLSILLAMVLAVAGGIALSAWLLPIPDFRGFRRALPIPPPRFDPRMDAGRRRAVADRRLEAHARLVGEIVASEGVDAAITFMDDLAAIRGIESYLIDADGHEVRGHELSPAVLRLAGQASESGQLRVDEADRRVSFTLRMFAHDRKPYAFIAVMPIFARPSRAFMTWLIGLRLAAFVVALSIVCFFLARYISNPVKTLRTVVRRFASGDLEQRVGSKVGTRRDELGELARDFDHMAERIATLVSAQRNLLQDISHELRSPLARQSVALELARQQAGPDAQEPLNRVGREGERLDELISELLTLTRLESEAEAVERTPVDLGDLLQRIVEDADYEARNLGRSVRLTARESCVTVGVPELLRRAVENVVRNAVTYTADGTAVDVSLVREGSFAVIRIRDRGPGVPEASLADIFRPFFRIGQARDRQSGGTGLGLAIAERAVRSHGGAVTAANSPDGGLVVEIRLATA